MPQFLAYAISAVGTAIAAGAVEGSIAYVVGGFLVSGAASLAASPMLLQGVSLPVVGAADKGTGR